MSDETDLISKLPQALLALRVSVFVVMLVWTLDKFINPAHSSAVFKKFYLIDGVSELILIGIGVVELLIIVCFVAGAFKRWTYGLVLLLHTISTLSAWALYIDTFKNLLFFAAWPMLAACWTLYVLRDADVLLAFDANQTAALAPDRSGS